MGWGYISKVFSNFLQFARNNFAKARKGVESFNLKHEVNAPCLKMGNFSDADIEQFPFLENYTVPDYWIDKMGITDEKILSLIKLALAS